MPKKKSSPLYGYLPSHALAMGRAGLTRTNAVSSKSSAALAPESPTLKAERETLSKIHKDLDGCMKCKLGKTRTQIVLGEGNPKAELMFVGEGPGEQEDLQGRPFVGRAGQLLDKMIEAMGLKRDQVFIANVVKCRPPDNRFPEPDEVETCSPTLFRQIDAIRPKVVIALGKCSAQTLLKNEIAISKMRGQFFEFRGTKLLPTFHPSYLLRNPSAKKEVWIDLQLAAREIGHKIPTRAGSA